MRRRATVMSVLLFLSLIACDKKQQSAPPSSAPQATPGDSTAQASPPADDQSSAPALDVTVPEGWGLIQETEKRRVLTKTDPESGTVQATIIVTRSSFRPNSETARRTNAEQFAPRVGEWDFSGQPATKKITIQNAAAYESVRRGSHRKSGEAHVVLVMALYYPSSTVTLLGMCLDDERADASLDQMRLVADGVSLK